MTHILWDSFQPATALAGGVLIGVASAILIVMIGRIAGISGIASRLLPPYADREFAGRLAFILGIAAAPLLVLLLTGAAPVPTIEATPPVLALAGLLVGFGAVWGNGCTSGHGVCGLSRLSLRSLVATGVFMATAIATVFVTRHLS